MTTPEITLESFKINIWYKAATYLGIVLIAITAGDSTAPVQYYHLGTLSLALGVIYLTASWLIGLYEDLRIEHHAQTGGRESEWNRNEVYRDLKPVVIAFEVFVVIGLIAWVAVLLAWIL